MYLIKILYILFCIKVCSGLLPANFCFNKTTAPIPKDHLFWTKSKPLVIGHRGQPRVFQENTLEGIKSLVNLGADGFEIDIYLTKDNELVVFHDDNTKRMTGEDHIIWDLTLEQVRNLTLKTSIQYGNNTYTFPDPLKIPTLEEIFLAVKDSSLFMYLEMKPSHNPRWNDQDTQRSINTGKAVAKLVTKHTLQSKAFLVSFDPVKPWAAKKENPELVVGTFFEKDDWMKTDADYAKLKQQYIKQLPGLDCLQQLSSSVELTKFLFSSGSVFKAINASFIDMDFDIYDNPRYSNNTFLTLRSNYNADISAGGWTLYSMKHTKEKLDKTDTVVKSLVAQRIERLITDDVRRTRKILAEISSSNRVLSSILTVFVTFSCTALLIKPGIL